MMTKDKKSTKTIFKKMNIVFLALVAMCLFACKSGNPNEGSSKEPNSDEQTLTSGEKSVSEPKTNDGFFDYKNYTKGGTPENLELIKMFERLRVTDVRDGMDWMGYHHYGSVDYSFRPLFRPATSIVGIARTGRYVPYEGPVPNLTPEEYTKWVEMYYKEISTARWAKDIGQGDFICLDIADIDVGLIGSANSLNHKKSGAVGYLLNGGGIRDTDECILQKINVWSKHISQPMNQARVRFIEKDIPIAIGGVAIYPGDVIVADGDGVIVVPRKIAKDVAKWAWHEASKDKVSRKRLYESLGMPLDHTVK